jgi:formylglycine-generating enzyme required for sulfatase activity
MISRQPLRFLGYAATVCAVWSAVPRTVAQNPPSLSLQWTAGSAHLTLNGDAGSPCTIEYTTNLSPGGIWMALTNYTLFGTSAQVVDSAAPSDSLRFYRAVIAVPANMAWVEAGTFLMGSPTNEPGRNTNEFQHSVTLTNGFFVGKYLVTQGAYLSLMNTNPSYYSTNKGFAQNLNRPVETVSWNDASNYCEALTQQQQASGQIFTNWLYRLPTESEWEYACRAGTSTPFYCGSNLDSTLANFDGEYPYVAGIGTSNNPNGIYLDQTTNVGSYPPNASGLYDMAGNVWEWCQDWYSVYPTNSVTNYAGPAAGTNRIFRGGALDSIGAECRSAERDSYLPTGRFDTVGFRVVLSAGPIP